MLLEFFGEDDQPLRVWDHDSRTINEIHKVPSGAWRSAWGRYAVNHVNSCIVLWDLDARKPLDLPLPEGATISDLICDSDQSTLLVSTADGTVWVIDLKLLTPRAKLEASATTGRTALWLSNDDRLLFWQVDETKFNCETGERYNPKTAIAIFDVSDLTD